MADFKQTLRTIVLERGDEIFLVPEQLLGLLADLAPELKKERSLMKILLTTDGINRLLSAKNAGLKAQQTTVTQVAAYLCENYGVDEAAITELCSSVLFALTGQDVAVTPAPVPANTQPRKQTPQPAPKPTPPPTPKPTPAPTPAPQPPKKGSGKVLAIVAAVLALLLGIVLISGGGDSATPSQGSQGSSMQGGNNGSSNTGSSNTGSQNAGTSNTPTHTHSWRGATCTAPRTCTTCGETLGAALGHAWTAGDCTKPRSCTVCGETSGTATGHTWRDATCANPRTCTACSATEGAALGHEWVKAHYETPKTCTRCAATEGLPLLHDPSRSFEDKMKVVRSYYTDVYEARHAGAYEKVRLRSGVYIHYDADGQAVYIDLSEGVEGLGGYGYYYNRMYYLSQGKLVFAFLEGDQEHRLYFYEEELIRWRYDAYADAEPVYYDLEDFYEYNMWERLALEEVASYAPFFRN